MNEQTIEIDCAPGTLRPDSYIGEVMKGSGVEYDGRTPVSTFFGNYTWNFSDIPAAQWKTAQPVFKERITQLYMSSRIRYGSW